MDEAQVKRIKEKILRASRDNTVVGVEKLNAAQNELLIIQNDEIIRLLSIIAEK